MLEITCSWAKFSLLVDPAGPAQNSVKGSLPKGCGDFCPVVVFLLITPVLLFFYLFIPIRLTDSGGVYDVKAGKSSTACVDRGWS